MLNRYLGIVLISLLAGSSVQADVIVPGEFPGSRPRPRRPIPYEIPAPTGDKTPPPTRLTVSTDPIATKARLIVPTSLSVAKQAADRPRVAPALPGTLVGLTIAGSLIAGGLWLARQPGAKWLVGTSLSLAAFVGLAVHAQPGRVDSPRTTIETGKVRISRGDGEDVQLILPKRS